MSSANDYLLPRNATESERLNLQHQIFESSLGYLVHPFILKHIDRSKDVLAVADIGCGTGIWLREAAKVFPSLANVSFTGLDISSAQFPANEARPPNTQFIEHDMLQPFPVKDSRKFDIVHARLIGQGFAKENWIKVIGHVMDLVKPKGYLQWTEPDHLQDAKLVIMPDQSSSARQNSSQGHIPSTPNLARIFAFSKKWQSELHWDRETNFALALRSNLEDHAVDFEVESVREEIVPCDFDTATRPASQRNALQIFAAALHNFVDRGLVDEEAGICTNSDVDAVLDGAKKELEGNNGKVIYRYYWRVVVAKKI